MKDTGTVLLAAAFGLFIGWIDTRPTWDDAGMTAGFILLTAAIVGAISPRRVWILGLTIGGGVTAMNIALHHSYAASVSLLIGLAGSWLGVGLRRVFGVSGTD